MSFIYLAQMQPVLLKKELNLKKFKEFMLTASNKGADLILFPELSLTGYFTRDHTATLAESIVDGSSILKIREWAKEYKIKTVFGFPELKEGKVFNSACFIDSDGSIIGSYQKNHLWDEESKYFSAGKHYHVWETDIGKVGIMICYDTEFPEVSRILALKGADIILAPTANMSPLEHSQRIYIQSRAAENQIFVATTNQIGTEESTYFFGESAAADPFGRLLVVGDQTESGYLVNIDLQLIQESRSHFYYHQERKPDGYDQLVKN